MKAIRLFLVFFILTQTAHAQVSVQVNMANPPAWAPAHGARVQYYYLPEIDAYFDVHRERFIYFDKARWIRAKKLPKKFNAYDLRKGKIVYLTDYKGKSPYKFHKKHKAKYKTVVYAPNGIQLKTKKDNGKHLGHKKNNKTKYKNKHKKAKR